MENEIKTAFRPRTIRWTEEVDALAVRLASEKGYTQTEGGVSRFLSDLVLAENGGEKTAGYEKQFAEIRKQVAGLKETVAKYTKKAK